MSGAGEPVIVRISRSTIEARDVDRIIRLFDGFVPGKLDAYRNRVRLQVDGYGGDPRELFEIGDVRDFFAELARRCKGLFYWLQATDDTLLLLGLMLHKPEREGSSAWLSAEGLQDFLAGGLRGLEDFCERNGVSPRLSEEAVTALVKKKIGN